MTGFEARDPGFEARTRASFARQGMMATLGAIADRVAPGEVELSMPFDVRFTQQHGFIHAGAIASCLDTACGFAALTLMPVDAGVLTVEFKLNLLAPGRGQRFRFAGRVLKPGRTLVFTEASAHAQHEADERLIATMTATMMAVTRPRRREGLTHGRPTIYETADGFGHVTFNRPATAQRADLRHVRPARPRSAPTRSSAGRQPRPDRLGRRRRPSRPVPT